jgi:hypothetical protein
MWFIFCSLERITVHRDTGKPDVYCDDAHPIFALHTLALNPSGTQQTIQLMDVKTHAEYGTQCQAPTPAESRGAPDQRSRTESIIVHPCSSSHSTNVQDHQVP